MRPVTAAIDAGMVDVVVQPIVDMRTGAVHGWEALSRPEDVAPDVAFSEAKLMGVEIQLDHVCLRSALALFPRVPPGQYLSVNILPVTIADPGLTLWFLSLPPELLGHLQRVNLRPRSESGLVLEVSETRDLNYAHIRKPLSQLRDHWRVAINDVGTEGSGLARIARIRPDILKLDRSLVRFCDEDSTKQWVLELFAAGAPKLPARIVAEGVERQEEADTLVDMGIMLGQGYLCGRPMSPDEAFGPVA